MVVLKDGQNLDSRMKTSYDQLMKAAGTTWKQMEPASFEAYLLSPLFGPRPKLVRRSKSKKAKAQVLSTEGAEDPPPPACNPPAAALVLTAGTVDPLPAAAAAVHDVERQQGCDSLLAAEYQAAFDAPVGSPALGLMLEEERVAYDAVSQVAVPASLAWEELPIAGSGEEDEEEEEEGGELQDDAGAQESGGAGWSRNRLRGTPSWVRRREAAGAGHSMEPAPPLLPTRRVEILPAPPPSPSAAVVARAAFTAAVSAAYSAGAAAATAAAGAALALNPFAPPLSEDLAEFKDGEWVRIKKATAQGFRGLHSDDMPSARVVRYCGDGVYVVKPTFTSSSPRLSWPTWPCTSSTTTRCASTRTRTS